MNDTRTNTLVNGFTYNVTNGSVTWSGYCASTSCSNTTFNITGGTAYFTNISNGAYFNTQNNGVSFNTSSGVIVIGNTFTNSITMTLTNAVNGSSISNFCGQVNSTVQACTTNGTLNLYGMLGTQTLTLYNISSSTYFNVTFPLTNYNTTNTVLSNTTYQALLNLTVAQLYTNLQISTFNATNNQGSNTTTTGYLFMPANNGTNTLTIFVNGNYSVTRLCTVNNPLSTSQCTQNTSTITALATVVGTNTSGYITSLYGLNDGDSYNVSEVGGNPGFDVEMNLTNVSAMDRVLLNSWYTGTANHDVILEAWNYVTSSWDVLGNVPQTTQFNLTTYPVTQGNNYLQNLNARLRVYHNDSGNAAHRLYLDYLSVQSTTGEVYDDKYNITAIDGQTNKPVSNFSVTATNAIGNTTVSSASNISQLRLLQGYNWTFTIDATGYALTNATLAANTSAQTYQFNLSPTNSVFVTVYNQDTLALLSGVNVTVSFTSGMLFYNQTSSTGKFLFQNLTAGNWSVSVTANNYAPSSYFISVSDRSTQQLNAYLAQNSVSIVFTNKDSVTGTVISGGTFTIQNQVGPNWVTVGQVTTDAFGQAVFQLLPLHDYQFIISAPGYFTKTGQVNTVITSYVVLVNANNTQQFTSYADDFSYKLTPDEVSANSTTFSMTTSSPQGALQWFAVVVNYNGTTYTQNITGSPSGGTATISLDFTNITGAQQVSANYYAKSVNINTPLVLSRSWYLYGGFSKTNYTFVDFVQYYGGNNSPIDMTARGILVTLVAVGLAAGTGIFLGAAPAMAVAATVFLLAGVFGWLGIGITIVTVGALIGLLLLGGRS